MGVMDVALWPGMTVTGAVGGYPRLRLATSRISSDLKGLTM